MAEIYRDDTTKTVTLSIVGATATSVDFVRGDTVLAGVLTSNTAPIPYAITHLDGDFDTVWDYTVSATSYTRIDQNRVVTPYFTADELTAYDSDMGTLTSDQVVKLERLVRGIIDAYTGQTFGLESGTVTCYGNDEPILMVGKRIVSITSIVDAQFPLTPYINTYRPISGGYAIERVEPVVNQTIKNPAWEETIYDPFASTADRFKNNYAYLVAGTFGWESVPYDVNLAALHLAEEFSCDESTWRDRYIKAIKGEGFDIDFRSEAFTGTGSVTADQLLGKYIANKLAII